MAEIKNLIGDYQTFFSDLLHRMKNVSIGAIVGKSLPNFIQQHKQVLTGVKEHGELCQPEFIAFENDKTSKFYDISLREIVILQGWDIENLLVQKA